LRDSSTGSKLPVAQLGLFRFLLVSVFAGAADGSGGAVIAAGDFLAGFILPAGGAEFFVIKLCVAAAVGALTHGSSSWMNRGYKLLRFR
jgi:hypothetical protein